MPKLLHAMVRVRDLAKSKAFYEQGFGLREAHRMEFPTFTLVYLREPESQFEIELTHNHDQAEPYTHGSGYGHLAFCVPDLAAHREQLLALGHSPGDLKELKSAAGNARFYFVTDPDGYKIEVLERAGHYV